MELYSTLQWNAIQHKKVCFLKPVLTETNHYKNYIINL